MNDIWKESWNTIKPRQNFKHETIELTQEKNKGMEEKKIYKCK